MICRLCLKDETHVFNIFIEKGAQLKVADIIAKHFWFEPKSDDPISTVICTNCWNKVDEFNEFYNFVEDRHRLLTERFSLTLDGNKSSKKSVNDATTITNDVGNCEAKTETENPAIAVEEYVEDYFTPDLEDTTNAETLNEIVTEIGIQPIESDDLHFGDENELAEYLSLEEGKSEEDALTILPSTEANNLNRPLTRSESKRNQTQGTDTVPKKCKRKIKSIKSKKTSKSAGRKRTSLKKVSETKVHTNCTKERQACTNSDDKTTEEKSDNRKLKYQNIDERISKHLALQCDVCGSKEATFGDLAKHMHEQHNFRRGYAICCDKKFYRRSLLYHHIEKHMDPDCFKCQQCEKSFASKQCLRNHMYVKHQPDEAKIFSCNFCEKKFAKGYLLEQHQKKHNERNHICELCEKGFPTLNLLNAHISFIHKNYGTMCDICAKVIRGRSAFAQHVLEHKGVTLPKVQCSICNAWYKNKHSLQKHIRRHNEEGTLHTCSDCGKTAPNRSALLAHKRYVHKDRIFNCGICKKSFKKQIGLKEHMTLHTGETLYSCPYCPRTFNSNANMHSHRKKIHPKEFAETRRQRHESKIMCSENEITSHQQEAQVQLTNQTEQELTLTSDDGSNILITSEKLNELVFEVS